jgi:hypothetical protein
MNDPVRTPSGGVFDRASLEEYVDEHGKDPGTGAPLSMDAVVAAADIADRLRAFQFQRLLGYRGL